MRQFVLILALFYAWQPTGLCACRLQAALFPTTANVNFASQDDDDDDDMPGECHCVGTKPLALHLSLLPVTADEEIATFDFTAECILLGSSAPVAAPFCTPPSPASEPLYVTLRALRI